MPIRPNRRDWHFLGLFTVVAVLAVPQARGDGLVKGPAKYQGSLEERSQEAIIIFQSSAQGDAVEDLILKITVEGEADNFAWIVPFPNQPQTKKADPVLFQQLFDYVQYRLRFKKSDSAKRGGKFAGGGFMAGDAVDVLSREVVGSYDVAMVRENTPGTLNRWLEQQGYQPIPDGEDVIEFYRKKAYVFACIKISEANLKAKRPVDIHPLHFTFKTGGSDGIYFPMRMTGLQKEPFAVNLYVFYQWWLNDRLNEYGYEHQGFTLKHRDWDGPDCKPDAGKDWGNPRSDPFLRDAAGRIGAVAGFFRKHYRDKRFYLTNIQSHGPMDPAEVRKLPHDLWLFPYYVDEKHVPRDALDGGPAAEVSRGTRR